MRTKPYALLGAAVALFNCGLTISTVRAAEAYPVFTDVNANAQAFGVAAASEFGGIYTLNSAATLNSNAVLSINQRGALPCCHGALIEVSISNGENGTSETAPPGHPTTPGGEPTPGVNNLDPPNTTAANAVFATIGNATGRLEAGNVIRFSAWFRSDPANPITVDPQVQPILKIEYFKEALSGFADTTGSKPAPAYGDRIFDQDQQGTALGIPDLPHWVDLDGDGFVGDASATVANGRVTQVSTSEWRLAEVTHTVNPADWNGIGGEAFGANDVTAVESIKAVMFMGDFAGTDLNGDGNGGNLLIDNVLVEVFKDTTTITSNLNPNPSLSEGLAGDYNRDGAVNAADYVVWRKNPAGFGGDPAGYNTWRTNFGRSAGAGSGLGQSAVPEPASFVLAAFAVAVCWLNHRR
jgi:hypothetical protein